MNARQGMSPTDLANEVFKAILEERFYIITHKDLNSDIEKRIARASSLGYFESRSSMVLSVIGIPIPVQPVSERNVYAGAWSFSTYASP